MSDRYALIDADGLVVNHVVWDGVKEWTPPDGHTARLLVDTESPVVNVAVYDDKTDTFTDDGTYKGEVQSVPSTPEQKLQGLLDTLVDRVVVTQEEADAISKAEVIVDGVVTDPLVGP